MPGQRLPMRQVREVLRLHHVCGQSGHQIAAMVGVSRYTVAEYLRRAGVVGITWPVPAALDAIRRAMAGQPVPTLAALGVAVPLLGSAVLGLALAEGALDAVAAHELASLDELFQVQSWGEDAEASARRQRIAEDIALAERFIQLSR